MKELYDSLIDALHPIRPSRTRSGIFGGGGVDGEGEAGGGTGEGAGKYRAGLYSPKPLQALPDAGSAKVSKAHL